MFIHPQWWLQKVLFYAQLAKFTYPIPTKLLEQQIQFQLKQLMKDLVCCSLDVNIPVQSNVVERRLFNRAFEAIDYYCLVQSPTPTESLFFWLAQLSLLISLSTDPNYTESESLGDNCGKNYGIISTSG